eukprot:914619_1
MAENNSFLNGDNASLWRGDSDNLSNKSHMIAIRDLDGFDSRSVAFNSSNSRTLQIHKDVLRRVESIIFAFILIQPCHQHRMIQNLVFVVELK